jgi:hypothetical protein
MKFVTITQSLQQFSYTQFCDLFFGALKSPALSNSHCGCPFSGGLNQRSTAIDTNIIHKIHMLHFSFVVRLDLSQ